MTASRQTAPATDPTTTGQTTTGQTTTGQTTIIPWDQFSDELLRYAWQPALRFALDCDHAAERCHRRACKLSGKCRMAVRDGMPLDCGGDLSEEVLARASGHVLFGCAMLRRFFEDLELVPVLSVPEVSEPAPRSSVSRRRKRG